MKIMIYHFYWECEILVDRFTSETIASRLIPIFVRRPNRSLTMRKRETSVWIPIGQCKEVIFAAIKNTLDLWIALSIVVNNVSVN